MQQWRSHGRRYGGIILLLAILAVLLFGWRASLASQDGATAQAAVTPLPGLGNDGPERIEIGANATPLPDLPVIVDHSLSPNAVPLTFVGHQPEHSFETYVVVRGDTPNGIAERFGIKPSTLLGGNPLLSQESSLLQTGVELIILPIDGVLHDVQPGDTLESIASQYGVDQQAIIDYAPNRLEFPYRLYPETQIMVPGAEREVFVWTPPTLSAVRSSSSNGVQPLVVGTGTYVYPVSGRNFTQFFWYGHPGLDIALGEGSAVRAADTGTVTFSGWNIYGYGNLIVVNHGNGFETLYAHLNSMNVVPGQVVTQGQIIGTSGNTGNSSGPHIHFEIRANGVQDNPCWYLGGC